MDVGSRRIVLLTVVEDERHERRDQPIAGWGCPTY